jgi:hypothetical protein
VHSAHDGSREFPGDADPELDVRRVADIHRRPQLMARQIRRTAASCRKFVMSSKRTTTLPNSVNYVIIGEY